MVWTIDYTDTARNQLKKLDRNMALRILAYMDERVARLHDPRWSGQRLTGPMGGLWRYRVGNCRVICDIQDERVRVLVLRVGRRDRVYRR
ncbi:MAG: type II toxin-antitoxin system RelE/ParE family toxin [bacterium]|nr:type II toxin-antitoxin system RelE/ParE family toxin [bacterium]